MIRIKRKNSYQLQSCIQTEYKKVHYCGLNIYLFQLQLFILVLQP